MNGPIENDIVLLRPIHQYFQLFSFSSRIRLAPVGSPVIRIVFRSIDIDIHFVPTIKIKLAYTRLLTPGSTVKTFYHTPIGNIRIVRHFSQRQLV